jgi:hypothetical protein
MIVQYFALVKTLKEEGMIRKFVIVLVLSLFGLTTQHALAEKDYASELERSKKELAEIEVKLDAQKTRLKELSREFNNADIALRQELIACKADMDEKAHIRESKRREGQLRQEHQAKMKPAKAEYNRLKVARAKCIKKNKSLVKKIDRLANDPEMETYNQEIDRLKQEIEDAKTTMNEKIAAIYDNAEKEIDQITDMDNKSKLKNQILSDAKVKELAIRKEYKEQKQAIVERMDTVRKDYRKNLAEFRAQRVEKASLDAQEKPDKKNRKDQEKTRKSTPATNFTVAR